MSLSEEILVSSAHKHPDLLPKAKEGPFKTAKVSGVPSTVRVKPAMGICSRKEPQEQECTSLMWPSHTCPEPVFPLEHGLFIATMVIRSCPF